jgi:hypothetical protein
MVIFPVLLFLHSAPLENLKECGNCISHIHIKMPLLPFVHKLYFLPVQKDDPRFFKNLLNYLFSFAGQKAI